MRKLLYIPAAVLLLSCHRQEQRPDSLITWKMHAGVTSFGDTIFTLYIPTGFTPNGDGINEIFYGLGGGIDPAKFELRIYNRYGNQVFFTTNTNKGWDGAQNAAANVCQEGTYDTQFEFTDTIGDHHLVQERILLIK